MGGKEPVRELELISLLRKTIFVRFSANFHRIFSALLANDLKAHAELLFAENDQKICRKIASFATVLVLGQAPSPMIKQIRMKSYLFSD